MTEKAIKGLKAKGKHLKIKKTNVQTKAIDSGSDISEPEVPGGKAPKMDKKELKQISSEVTDLLTSLKKEHGMEVDDLDVKLPIKKEKPEKTNKNKKDGKNVQKVAAVEVKNGQKLQPQNNKPKQNETKKQKPAKANAVSIKKEKDAVAQPNGDSPKKKKNKNKNKKRAAAETEENDDEEPQAKKAKENPKQKNKNQKQNQAATKAAKKNNASKKVDIKEELDVKEEVDEEVEEGEGGEEADAKKEYYLKNAHPVFVGNLPTNIKRLKLVNLFKKFGKILSIRFRTNNGHVFYKKAQTKKVPHLIAFVYMESREAAEACLEKNGTQIGDNVITVDIDTKDKKTVKPNQTVVLGNLKYAVTDHILREAFKCCGEIERVRTVQSLKGCNGVAFIRFAKPESCELALKLNGTQILDREVRVERYSSKKSKNADASDKSIKKEKTPKQFGKKPINAIKKEGAKAGGNKGGKTAEKKKKNKEFVGAKSNDAKKQALDKKKKKKKNKMSDEKRLAQKVAPKKEKPSE